MNTRPPEMQASAPAGAATGDKTPIEVLSFELGLQTYGIDISRVQEVRSYAPPTRLPQAVTWLLGVMNLRGVIVPAVDLRTRLGFAPRFDERTVTVVLNLDGRTVGVVVDSVSDVVALAESRIKRPPPSTTAVDTRHVRGLAELGDGGDARLLILLDAESLLRDLNVVSGDAQRIH